MQSKDLPIRCPGFAATVRFDSFQRVEAGVVNSPRQRCARRCEERPSDLTGAWSAVGQPMVLKWLKNLDLLRAAGGLKRWCCTPEHWPVTNNGIWNSLCTVPTPRVPSAIWAYMGWLRRTTKQRKREL
jgi:hypothetical protein